MRQIRKDFEKSSNMGRFIAFNTVSETDKTVLIFLVALLLGTFLPSKFPF